MENTEFAVNISQIFSISCVPMCKCLVANEKKTKWRVVKLELEKKKLPHGRKSILFDR